MASASAARELGALVVFDSQVFPAAGTRKLHTCELSAFGSPGVSPLGSVGPDNVRFERTAHRAARPLDIDALDLTRVRVDIVTYYPGADTTLLRAAADAGATGIVVEGTGAGNANPAFCREIANLSSAGIVVALTTRVSAGPVIPRYGNGDSADLVVAGAIPSSTLRAPQTRILLAALLASHREPGRAAAELRDRLGQL